MRAELLDLALMQDIYQTFLVHDFPAQEVKPFSAIASMYQRGVYFGFAFFEQDEIVAYAFFVQPENAQTVLLDYFAVVSDRRGQGIGTKALQLMREELPFLDGIVLESEDPEFSENQAELTKRNRRIAFYERAGVRMTKLGAQVYGVDYVIMYFPLHTDRTDAGVFRDLKMIYSAMFPPEILRTRITTYRDRAKRG